MAVALPPDDDNDEEREPIIRVYRQGEPEPTTVGDMAQSLAVAAVFNMILLVVAAAIFSYAWNHLTDIHHLTTLNFNQAFTAAVLLRVTALTVRL